MHRTPHPETLPHDGEAAAPLPPPAVLQLTPEERLHFDHLRLKVQLLHTQLAMLQMEEHCLCLRVGERHGLTLAHARAYGYQPGSGSLARQRRD